MIIMILLAVIVVTVVATTLALWRWGSGPTAPVDGRVEQCCRCNAEIAGAEIHEIVAVPTDDRAIGIEQGGTYVAADFCADCCLGPAEGCAHPDHARLTA